MSKAPTRTRRKIAAREKDRDRPMVTVTLSPEAIRAGDTIADMRGMTRSALYEFLIREESLRMRVKVDPVAVSRRRND